jgi:hypothetical protein
MTLHHQATERKAEGLERRFQQTLEWLSERPRHVMLVLAAALVIGLLSAGVYEWVKRREGNAQVALARVERAYSRAMGDERSAIPVEPASAEQARHAREQALTGFELVEKEHAGSRAAQLAQVRAAEMEIDLGQLDAGLARLAALAGELDADDPLRAVALRLRAYANELAGNYVGAAEDYAAAAAVESYPGGALLWVAAGESFERGGATDRALDALRQGLSSDPVLAEQLQVVRRIEQLEQQLAAQQAAAQPPATPVPSEPAKPEAAEPAKSAAAEPAQSEAAEPAEPEAAEPAQPEAAEPAQPEAAEPAQSEAAEPAEPEAAEPAQPAVAEPAATLPGAIKPAGSEAGAASAGAEAQIPGEAAPEPGPPSEESPR